MTATERLFWADPALYEFEASVVRAERRGDLFAVVLDRTAFFPAAGGQPSDRGALGAGRVVDALEEGEAVVHLVEGLDTEPSGTVSCRVDVHRREDLACQHTAQHVVSALARDMFGARTVGFHLGERATTIDFEGGGLDGEKIRSLEREANRSVRGGRAVRISFETGRERRVGEEMVKEEGPLRVVAIEGLSESACCGSHVAHTGEIGAIRLGHTEKVRAALRVELHAGDRVLDEAERLHGLLASLSALSGAGIDELPTWAQSALAEARSLKKEISELASCNASLEADAMLATAEAIGGAKIAARVVSDRDAKALKLLAGVLRMSPGIVAIVGAAFDGKAALVVARGEGVALDVRPILKAAAEALGAKGGGTADLAQCGGGDPGKLEAAVASAREQIHAALV